jgi:hypothetical protein
VTRQARCTVGTNRCAYSPVSDDVAIAETLQNRWKVTRAGLIGHFPTFTRIPLRLIA